MDAKILRSKREDRGVANTLEEEEEVERGDTSPPGYEGSADAPDAAHDAVQGEQESRIDEFEQYDANEATNGKVELAVISG